MRYLDWSHKTKKDKTYPRHDKHSSKCHQYAFGGVQTAENTV